MTTKPKESRIPEISDQRLSELSQQIKPVVREGVFKKGEGIVYTPFYIENVDPRRESFLWKPKHTSEAVGLVKFDEILTYHTYGYYAFFKPSIAEVLAQLERKYSPEELSKVVAFETNYVGLDPTYEYHVARTTLFAKESNSQ